MTVNQVASIVNAVQQQIVGENAIQTVDLTGLIDMGKQALDATSYDNYVKTLVDHIGKVVFVNRPYQGSAPSVLMDGWEYGSILEKISGSMPEATENETWELQNGKSYDPNVFYQPKVQAKFFNSKTTFEVDQSFTERQVKSAFSSATQMNAFLSMLKNEVEKSLTIKSDSLVMRTINNMTAQTLHSGGARVVNLLTLFNQAYASKLTAPLTADEVIHTPEFIRYASYIMSLYTQRLANMSEIFNMGGQKRFTPSDKLHIVLLDEFAKSSDIFLQSDVYHNELTKFPKAETVAFWQGSGTNYNYNDTSAINVKIKSADSADGIVVNQKGILGVMFDRDALGVCNIDRRVTTNYNPKAEFFTNFHKYEAGYFNDGDENFVVFIAS